MVDLFFLSSQIIESFVGFGVSILKLFFFFLVFLFPVTVSCLSLLQVHLAMSVICDLLSLAIYRVCNAIRVK